MKLNDLSKETKEIIIKIAEQSKPREMCGLIVQDEAYSAYYPKYPFIPCENVATHPTETFEIGVDEWATCLKIGAIEAVVHSHPNGEAFLSGADRQSQVATDLPWILVVSGSLKWFEPAPHLRGREFVYDKADCCRLIQDAYHLCGLNLLDGQRIDIDADIEQQMLLRYFEQSEVFERVQNIQAGDVVLTSSNGKVPDHAALYLGNDEILHHVHNRLSGRESYGLYWQKCTHSIWRHKKWQPEMMAAILADLLHSH